MASKKKNGARVGKYATGAHKKLETQRLKKKRVRHTPGINDGIAKQKKGLTARGRGKRKTANLGARGEEHKGSWDSLGKDSGPEREKTAAETQSLRRTCHANVRS